MGEDAYWGITEHLLALLVELTDRNFLQLVAMTPVEKKHEGNKKRLLKRKPIQIPRPGVGWRGRKKGTTLGELVGMMGGKTEV